MDEGSLQRRDDDDDGKRNERGVWELARLRLSCLLRDT